jgi:hypothetical protein
MNNNQISYLNSSHKTQPAEEMSMYRQNPNVTKKKRAKTTAEVNQHTHQRIFQCCTSVILLGSAKYLRTVYVVKKKILLQEEVHNCTHRITEIIKFHHFKTTSLGEKSFDAVVF